MIKKINALKKKRQKAEQGGGAGRIENQHSKGKYTARERINLLVDKDSFVEVDKFIKLRSTNFSLDKEKFDGDGVITGYGTVNGRIVFLASQDFTVLGGLIFTQ